MSTSTPISLETQIFETLNRCIEKISKHLDKNFNPEDPKSLSLFRQFCSALNTRRNWIKNFIKDFQQAAKLVGCRQKETEHNQKTNSANLSNIHSNDFQKKSKKNGKNQATKQPNSHPPTAEELKSGLLRTW
jgi:hypothetical protein